MHGLNPILRGAVCVGIAAPSAPATLAIITKATSTGGSITVPASVQAGDLLVLQQRAQNASGVPSDVTPANWSDVGAAVNVTNQSRRTSCKYRIAPAGYGGASVTGMNGTSSNHKILWVLRAETPITAATPGGLTGTAVLGNPAAQTITASGGTAPLATFAAFGASSTFVNVLHSPTADDSASAHSGDQFEGRVKIFNASPADVTFDIDDSGDGNHLTGFYIAAEAEGSGGGPFEFNKTISSDLLNQEYDVATDALANGWNGTSALAASITVSAKIRGPARSSTETFAFDTGILPAGSTVAVTVTGTGKIWAGGGKGGNGGDGSAGLSGVTGGTAMNFQAPGSVTINAGGEVVGGSGGGGGAGSRATGIGSPAPECFGGSGSGGGGGGWPNGAAGLGAGSFTVGNNGSAGTESGGGTGGTGDNSQNGGAGGNKNGAAASGANASAADHSQCGGGGPWSGGSAGAQGIGIKKNGNTVSVTNSGTLQGNPAEQA